METQTKRPHLYNDKGRMATLIEGVVADFCKSITTSHTVKYGEDGKEVRESISSPPSLLLRIRTHKDYGNYENYTLVNAPFDVNIGDRVLLYSLNDFRYPYSSFFGDFKMVADALQIFDEEGKVKHQSIHKHLYILNHNLEFR